MRSVERIELPSTNRVRQSTALSTGRYILAIRSWSEKVLRQDRQR
jgi:hypothetical protein